MTGVQTCALPILTFSAAFENLDARIDDIEDKVENQPNFSKAAEKVAQESLESSAIQHESDEGVVQSSSAFAPGYVPSELDERIVIELPSTMVQSLRVVQGTFQVSLMIYSLHFKITNVLALK